LKDSVGISREVVTISKPKPNQNAISGCVWRPYNGAQAYMCKSVPSYNWQQCKWVKVDSGENVFLCKRQ